MARELFEAAIAMIVGTFITIIMVRYLGQTLDLMVATLIDVGIYDVSPVWQTDPSALINLFYVICMLPMVLGFYTGIMLTQRKTEVSVGLPAQEEFEIQEFQELR